MHLTSYVFAEVCHEVVRFRRCDGTRSAAADAACCYGTLHQALVFLTLLCCCCRRCHTHPAPPHPTHPPNPTRSLTAGRGSPALHWPAVHFVWVENCWCMSSQSVCMSDVVLNHTDAATICIRPGCFSINLCCCCCRPWCLHTQNHAPVSQIPSCSLTAGSRSRALLWPAVQAPVLLPPSRPGGACS